MEELKVGFKTLTRTFLEPRSKSIKLKTAVIIVFAVLIYDSCLSPQLLNIKSYNFRANLKRKKALCLTATVLYAPLGNYRCFFEKSVFFFLNYNRKPFRMEK